MVKTYTTTQGDTWDAIAHKLWDAEGLFRHLVEVNPEHLDVLIFPAGVTLRTPEVEKPLLTADLPPWMQA